MAATHAQFNAHTQRWPSPKTGTVHTINNEPDNYARRVYI